jgi:hypothetical protein
MPTLIASLLGMPLLGSKARISSMRGTLVVSAGLLILVAAWLAVPVVKPAGSNAAGVEAPGTRDTALRVGAAGDLVGPACLAPGGRTVHGAVETDRLRLIWGMEKGFRLQSNPPDVADPVWTDVAPPAGVTNVAAIIDMATKLGRWFGR